MPSQQPENDLKVLSAIQVLHFHNQEARHTIQRATRQVHMGMDMEI